MIESFYINKVEFEAEIPKLFELKVNELVKKPYKVKINGNFEELPAQLKRLRGISGFEKFHFKLEELFKIKCRVGDNILKEVVIPKDYLFYINKSSNLLLSNINKEGMKNLVMALKDRLADLNISRKNIDLNKLLKLCRNTKGCWFRDLKIETLTGASLFGNNVAKTKIFQGYNKKGELVSLTYHFDYKNNLVKVKVSKFGNVSFFQNLPLGFKLKFLKDIVVPALI